MTIIVTENDSAKQNLAVSDKCPDNPNDTAPLIKVGFYLRWGSIALNLVFDWGYINIFKGWGCIQEWGCIQVDTVSCLNLPL